jgi:hypothetical protein
VCELLPYARQQRRLCFRDHLAAIDRVLVQQSLSIHHDAQVSWPVSPALLPVFLGGCLLLCSLILLFRSWVGQRLPELVFSVAAHIRSWFGSADSDWQRIVGGIVLLGVYIFVLIPVFEFWLSASLFLLSIFLFLRAAAPWKIVLVTIGSVGGIILLFANIFNVMLP